MGYSLIDQLLLLIYIPHVELNDIDIVFLTSIKTKCVTHLIMLSCFSDKTRLLLQRRIS